MAKAFPLFTVNSVGRLADNAPLMLHIRLAELLHFARHIDDVERVAELHNMRIAAKRLRYTMELFLPYVTGPNGKALSSLLDRTKKVQEMIGEIHDRDVRIPLIMQFVEKQGRKRPEVQTGLIALAEQEQAERSQLYHDLLSYWTEQQGKYVGRMSALIAALSQEALAGGTARASVADDPAAPEDQSTPQMPLGLEQNADSGS